MAEYVDKNEILWFADKYLKHLDDGEAYRRIEHWIDNIPPADAIEELSRRLEQALYMPLPKWISVKERLPITKEMFSDCESFEIDKDGEFHTLNAFTCYESDTVLVYGIPQWHNEAIIETAKYTEWVYEDGEKAIGWRETVVGDFDYEVTHWMPLPQPPKEEADDGV